MAKKAGSIALPFLFSFLIGLLLIGGAVIYIYKAYIETKPDDLKVITPSNTESASYADSHTVLFSLDIPEQKSVTFVVMRAVPRDKKLLLTGIPTNTITLINGSQTSLLESYQNGGMNAAVNFIEEVMGISIDRYMKFNSDAFQKLSDILGGVSYTVTVKIPGFKDTDREQYLNGKQTIQLLTYPAFSGGEVERASMAASVMSAMINQSDGDRLNNSIDRNFNEIINLVTETNITAVDFKDKKNGIKFMLKYGKTISHFSMINGTASGGSFIINESYSQTIKDSYFAPHNEESK